MAQYSYFGVLVACLFGTAWLEILLRTRVYRRSIRLILAIFPVLIIFSCWDAYAVSAGHWTFNPHFVTGWIAYFGIPMEEIFFFIAIPICSILTLEAVRSAKGWIVGDEISGIEIRREDGAKQ